MGIELRLNTSTGLTEPYYQCDACREQIADARLGLYVWGTLKSEPKTDVWFVHKGSCDQQLESEKRGGLAWSTMELGVLTVYLDRNSGVGSKEDRENAESAADMNGGNAP